MILKINLRRWESETMTFFNWRRQKLRKAPLRLPKLLSIPIMVIIFYDIFYIPDSKAASLVPKRIKLNIPRGPSSEPLDWVADAAPHWQWHRHPGAWGGAGPQGIHPHLSGSDWCQRIRSLKSMVIFFKWTFYCEQESELLLVGASPEQTHSLVEYLQQDRILSLTSSRRQRWGCALMPRQPLSLSLTIKYALLARELLPIRSVSDQCLLFSPDNIYKVKLFSPGWQRRSLFPEEWWSACPGWGCQLFTGLCFRQLHGKIHLHNRYRYV